MTESSTGHSAAALALAKHDYEEHMVGIKECHEMMMTRPLVVKCYSLDDPKAPSIVGNENKNVKLVHFVRHGQGFHNLMADQATKEGRIWEQCTNDPKNPYIMPEILDAPLTNKGREQAIRLQRTIKALDDSKKPQLVVLSPNCRALQTGVLAFEEFVGTCPFIAHEMVREETGVHVCDQRRPRSRQAREFPMVDFSLLLDEEDTLFDKNRRESKVEVSERCYKFLDWLELRDESVVGVASHSAWLLTIFNANLDADERLKGWFQTGEMRSAILEFVRK